MRRPAVRPGPGADVAVRVEVLGSGSRGNCTFVHGGRTRLLVDAGFSRAEIVRRLERIGETPERLDGIVVTHEHGDHVRGADVLSRRHGVPVFCHEDTVAHGGLDPDTLAEWIPVHPGRTFAIGDIELDPFFVPHDAVTTLGYRLRTEGVSIGYCTDLGHVTALVRERLRSCHVLIVESNHDLEMLRDGPYPWSLKQRVGGRHGHLSNDAACSLLADVVDSEVSVVALAHLSEANNEPILAVEQARDALLREGRESVRVFALPQDEPRRVALA